MIKIEIFNEDAISWEVQNKIHRLLNITFRNKSQKFIAKTYANVRPHERIVFFEDGEAIAHLGMHNDKLHMGNLITEATCLGLWCALNNSRRLATSIMQSACEYLQSKGVKLGLGVTNSQVVLRYILPEIRHIQSDVQIKGKNSTSKPDDKTIFFGIGINDTDFDKIKEKSLITDVLYLETEVF